MDKKLQNIVMSTIVNYSFPLTFNSLFLLVKKQRKIRKGQLLNCLKYLQKQNKLELFEDLYKYYNSSIDFKENRIYPSDFCHMSINHRWEYYQKSA